MKKEGESNKSVVTLLTLNNHISNQLLISKNEEKHTTDSTSVELWIKSLKDTGDLTDDSRSDHDNTDSCSDQDDLQLGAEATDLLQKKRQKSRKNGSSLSDSEDSRYSPRRSRNMFLMKGISTQTSLDSDTSNLSSLTSLSSLLTARESDPEEVLKGLGFAGPNVLDNIPNRFIFAGTRCQGINTKQFLGTLNVDSSYEDCDFPPWVMARMDEIPKKFLQSSTSNVASLPKQCSVPLIEEPPSNTEGIAKEPGAITLSRPPKSLPFPSRFGTFLEPVSEEVELASQGSVNLSPVTIKNLSFESNRSSTLKSLSHDETSEGIMKIPSLKDLWESQPNETDHFSSRDDFDSDDKILTDDVVEYTPKLNSLEHVDESRMSDEVLYRGLDEVSGVAGKGEGQGPSEDIVAVDESASEKEKLIPTVLDHLASEAMPISEKDSVLSDIDEEETDKLLICGDHSLTSGLEKDDEGVKRGVCTNTTSQSTNSYPSPGDIKISIPIVKVTSSSPRRKISTVVLPDYTKLVPSSPDDNPESLCSNNDSIGKLEELTCTVGPVTTLQLNFYEKWVVTRKARQPQVHISNKARAKDDRVSSSKNFKLKDVSGKVTVRKPSSHLPTQIVLPQIPRQNIECFVNVETGCVNNGKVLERESSAAASVCCSEVSSGFVSMATHSNYSFPEDDGNHRSSDCGSPKKKLEHDQGGKVDTEECSNNNGIELSFNYQKHHAKKDSVNFCSNVGRTDNGKLLKNEQSFEEELDGLQSSLKGVSLYKAGIHLMQLASSIESFSSPEPQSVSHAIKSSPVLLGSIQNELNHLEGHIKHLQKELTEYKDQKKNFNGEKFSRGNDFSKLTRQLLHEQLKMFNCISSSVSPSPPSSTPNTQLTCGYEETLPAFTEDFSLRDDIRNLRIEVQTLRQQNEGHHSMVKNEILSEVRTEIKNCFSEFLERFGSKT